MDEAAKDRLFAELFPLPADAPPRSLRFGAPVAAEDLPSQSFLHASAGAPPRALLKMVWSDEELGLSFLVHEEDGGEVLAVVESADASLIGKTVSLSFFGDDVDRRVRHKLKLNSRPEGGCIGRVSFGQIKELVDTLGKTIQPTHFLID